MIVYFKGKHEGTQQPTDCAVNIHISAYLADFHVLYTLGLSAVLADKTATKNT